MGNCWARFEEWLCPNPWSGLVIDKLDYHYTVRSVSLDEVYNSVMATSPLSTTASLSTQVLQPPPQKQQHLSEWRAQPLQKTQPLPAPILAPLTPPIKNMEELPAAVATAYEQKTPLLTAMAQPKHYNSVSSSPLILNGKLPAPAPPPLSLLNITMQKPLHIEY